jgi:hypothetical protein
MLAIRFLLLCCLCIACKKPSDEVQFNPLNSLETIVNDMKKCHDALPKGVPPHFDWQKCPRLGMANSPGNMQAMIPWGQIYEAADGNPAINTRVQVRNIQAWFLSKKTGKWTLWGRSQDVHGAAYAEDFANDRNVPADIRKESDGSVSVKAGNGYNFHYWSSQGRVTIDPSDIAGVWTFCEARLITDDPNKTDDRAKTRYLLSMGADYWLNLSAQWTPDWKSNGDVAIGRFKWVSTEWQAFNMHSMKEEDLRKNPPPVE